LPAVVRRGDTRPVISNVIIHLHNELPVMVDLAELPAGGDRNVTCTNVRGVDGKRPQFVHDRNGVFVIPMGMIRLIEAPAGAQRPTRATREEPEPVEVPLQLAGPSTPSSEVESALVPVPEEADETPLDFDEEPDEDLLARIRSV
jgi:hypothetical protein